MHRKGQTTAQVLAGYIKRWIGSPRLAMNLMDILTLWHCGCDTITGRAKAAPINFGIHGLLLDHPHGRFKLPHPIKRRKYCEVAGKKLRLVLWEAIEALPGLKVAPHRNTEAIVLRWDGGGGILMGCRK